MIEINELIEFINHDVDIGVAKFYSDKEIFYHSGLLTSVADGFVKLRQKTGYRLVPIVEILEIRISGGRHF